MSRKSIRKMLSLRDLDSSQASIARVLRVDPSIVSKWIKKARKLAFTYDPSHHLVVQLHPIATEKTMKWK